MCEIYNYQNLFWYIFGNLYIKYQIIFRGLDINFSKDDKCLWCGNTVEDRSKHKNLLYGCNTNNIIRCEVEYTCGRCKHSIKIDLVQAKLVTIEVVPEGGLYKERYEKTFNIDDVLTHYFYTRGKDPDKYPGRVMFNVKNNIRTIYKTQMSLKDFEILFPNSERRKRGSLI